MEGGSKVNISLESPLDVSSSDMLVPVSQPTFQHNWQKYQGKFLPNSIRYEQNGWAAGWNVYEFEYSSVKVPAGNGRVASKSRLNDNPTYLLSLYGSETSPEVLTTVAYNEESHLLAVDAGEAVLEGDKLKGSFGNVSYELIWDHGDRTYALSSSGNMSAEFVLNNDYTASFTFTDEDTSLEIDMEAWVPGQLSGSKLSAQGFSGCSGGVCEWDQFKYDAASNTVTLPSGGTVVPSLSDGNMIEFDFSEVIGETFEVSYELKDMVVRFDDIKVRPYEATNKDMLACVGSSTLFKFDKIMASAAPASLLAEDPDGIAVTAKVAMWLSASVNVSGMDAGSVRKPENIEDGNVMVYVDSKGQKAVAISTFGQEKETEFTATGWQPVQMPARYCKITLSNSIRKGSRWQPYKVKVNSAAWCFASKRFSKLYNSKQSVEKMLGNLYKIGTCQYDWTQVFGQNDCWDTAVSQFSDIDGIRSVKLAGDAPSAEFIDDRDYVDAHNTVTQQDLLDQVCKMTGTYTLYSASSAPISAAAAWSGGLYTGGTYEDVGVVLSEGSDFWPFRYVPCFNLDGVGKCYYADGARTITELWEFKQLVMGDYLSVPLENEILLDQGYSRTRDVVVHNDAADYNKIKQEEGEKLLEFNNIWKKWYPSDTDPNTMNFSMSDDSKYLDWKDVNTVYEDIKIKFIPPSVKLDNDVYIFTCNKQGIMLYDVPPGQPTISWKVFHNAVDRSDLYKPIYEWDYNLAGTYPVHSLVNVYTNPSKVSTMGYTYAKLYLGSREYVLPYLEDSFHEGPRSWDDFINSYVRPELVSYKFPNIGYSSFDLTDASYSAYNWNISADASYVTCTLQAKDKSVTSEAWAEQIRWNTPILEYTYQKYQYSSYNGSWYVSKYRTTSFVLNEGLRDDAIGSLYYSKTTFGGVMAMPLWGNVGCKVTYPEVRATEDFKLKADSLIVEELPDSDPRVDKDRAIWLDRNGGKGKKLFKLNVVQVEPVDDSDIMNLSGYMTMAIKALGDESYIFFAKKLYNSEQKEIKGAYYCPGIAFGTGDYNDDTGNMNASNSDLGMFNVEWKPTQYTCPTSAFVNFSKKISPDYIGYNDVRGLLDSCEIVLGKNDYDTLMTPVDIKFGDNVFSMVWSMLLKSTIALQQGFTVEGCAVEVGPVNIVPGASVDVPVAISLEYKDNVARFPKVSDGYVLKSLGTDGKMLIGKGSREFTYDWIAQKLSPTRELKVETNELFHHVTDDIAVQQKVTAVMKGAYDGEMDGRVVRIEYAGNTYEVDLSMFDGKSDVVSLLSTDVRKPDKTRVVGTLDPSTEYQLVKQQWNSTVETENFWWVNQTHILELDRYNFVLKRKTSEVDDWNGDRWEKVYEVPRASILLPPVIQKFAASVYGSNADSLFVTLETSGTYTVKCTVYDIIKEMSHKFEVFFTLDMKQVGQKLNDKFPSGSTGYFNTYSVLTAAQLLSQGEWTSTIVDGRLIIGCRLSKNVDQWSSVVNTETGKVERVVQGYGCVGLSGCLTGGQVPSDYFSEAFGFNGTVMPLSYLLDTDGDGTLDSSDLDSKFHIKSLAELNQVKECVVGTGEQQWYVKKELKGIVSHLEYVKGGTFSKKVIPLTNNFCATYKSPSFANVAFGDMSIQVSAFKNLLNLGNAQGVWNTLMNMCGAPMLYYFAPRRSSLAYLQQTIGQYAYVHYNSSQMAPESDPSAAGPASIDFAEDSGLKDKNGKNAQAPVLSDAMTFGKQVVKQDAILSSTTLDFMAMVFFAFADALQVIDTKASINSSQNQSAVKDTGRKYTQAALENLSGMISSSVITQSADTGIQSTVVGLKSLDMFYSTSDKQNVFAGPGFVEHQFVADCVAQSTVDVHIEGRVQQLMFVIAALTYFHMDLTSKLTDIALEMSVKMGESTDNLSVCGSNFGGAAGLAVKAAAFAIKMVKVTQQVGMEAIKKVVEILSSKGLTCTEQGRVTHHEMNNEASHKYGEKNEVFMWPCWGVPSDGLDYSDEHVECGVKDTPINIALPARKYYTSPSTHVHNIESEIVPFGSSIVKGDKNSCSNVYANHEGKLPYYQAACYGVVTKRKLPADMAKIEGVESLLPSQAFKNENIGASAPVFAATLIHDYVVDMSWNLSMCCTGGLVEWVTCKDTKLINGPASNMYVNSNFCGVAAPYVAVEVKRGITKRYMRPWAVTPEALAFNVTGYNSVLDSIMYHAFDGISYRIVELTGSPGLGKQRQSWLYAFQLNDRFKRSNKCPPAVMMGNFEAEPVQYVNTIDKFWTVLTTISKEKGLAAGAPGEDKDVIRWSIPVFTEHVSTLPAAVKTLTAVPLAVVDGITGLVTDLVSFLSAYKAPLSVDFTIGKNVYRMTQEYICSVSTQSGIDVLEDLVPVLGLTFIGASPTEAYLYSRATRCYYVYTGGTSLTKMDMMERFRNIQKGYWDFVNQEVVMPCLMTFKRLNKHVEDKDTETDNIIVPVMSGSNVSGELPPPVTTLFNDRSWYKAVSLPCGFAYQGPNRVVVNRSVFVEYMLDTMKQNLGKWKRLPREKYATARKYQESFETVEKDVKGVRGWTHNQFVLVTSAVGADESTDCLFEWEVTFCWPIEMDLLYGPDNMAVVNLMAETMTPGGKVETRPVHVFLTKELFTRNGAYGYYSFRYQSKNGAGNRERLHIWSDSYIAISKISCEYKMVTQRRSEQLTQQADVQSFKEL